MMPEGEPPRNFYRLTAKISRMLRESPEALRDYYRFNSGSFGHLPHPELASGNPVLTPPEVTAVRAVSYYLSRHDRVAVADFGAMLGFSMAVLGVQFARDVADGRLLLIATNREQFAIPAGIAEARRRLTVLPLYRELMTIDPERFGTDAREWHRTIRMRSCPILETDAEIDFLEHNHFRVHYVSGIDAKNIGSKLHRLFGVTGVHLLHESYGGIDHARQRERALGDIRHLGTDDGMIMTTTPLWQMEDAFGRMERERGTRPYFTDIRDDHQATYVLYANGGLPREAALSIIGEAEG